MVWVRFSVFPDVVNANESLVIVILISEAFGPSYVLKLKHAGSEAPGIW